MKRVLGLALVLILLFASTACSAPQTVEKGYNTDVIRINVASGFTHVLSTIIREKDYLPQYLPAGVETEWLNVIGSADIRDGITSGNIDISILSSMTVVSAIENGLPFSIISKHIISSAAIFSKDPNIRDLSDLPMAKDVYITSLGASTTLAIYAMCKDEFGDIRILENKFVPMETAVALPLFESTNDIACIANSFPNIEKIKRVDGAHQVVDLTKYAQKYDLGNYFVANESFYNDNPMLIEAFRNAQKDALDFLMNKPDEAAELLANVYEIDASIIADEIKSVFPRLEVSGYDNCAELLYEAGILEQPPKKFSELPNYEDIPKAG